MTASTSSSCGPDSSSHSSSTHPSDSSSTTVPTNEPVATRSPTLNAIPATVDGRKPAHQYLVNDIFYTLQGEGFWTGRPAVFVRFSRCNLWTGREEDRATAICRFCDTDFTHATKYPELEDLVDHIADHLPRADKVTPMVVLTGGEPMLQVDKPLVSALLSLPAYVAVETNGTQPIPFFLDWVCVSPKAGTKLAVTSGDELKVVYPQPGLNLDKLRQLDFQHFWISPMDGPNLAENTAAAIEYVKQNPQWRLNIQTHKAIGVK